MNEEQIALAEVLSGILLLSGYEVSPGRIVYALDDANLELRKKVSNEG